MGVNERFHSNDGIRGSAHLSVSYGIIGVVLVFSSIDWFCSMTRLNNLIGFVHPRFEKVEKVFRKNFHDGWEREGAAIAVYHKGELLVDLQGGYADKSSGRKWTPETRTVVFSATKAVGALCVAMLVDRGLVSYEDKMSKFWPEFAQNGKGNITIKCLMSHQAGLAALDEPISREDAKNFEKMAYIIAKQKPNWEPGTKSGYHAITYGWIVDQIVRRVDPQRRSVGQFFREEVAIRHGIDFHIGLPSSEEHTVSRLSVPSKAHIIKEIIYDPRVLIVLAILHLRTPTSIARKVNPQWLKLEQDLNTFNDPELHSMEQVAALGITKARDLARTLLTNAKRKTQLLERFKTPLIASGIDEILMTPLPKGYGFLYERHPTVEKSPVFQKRWLVGHPGFGGSTVMMDMDEEVVIAYVTNGFEDGMVELTRTYRSTETQFRMFE
ncbi:Beta-lactamase domain-containing protein 2 [Parelaphostrongylus tenuis]|uniref:Beta-lactamase domain-containing protein 2 n=1 Tax=Parelaphostrongylus tenuis TaxID=148309 RepID=A0AAD5QEY6_PARTN|nr:Beta-lactamase domain-containing protein 2 [Parelaphostrongylus tenuis]